MGQTLGPNTGTGVGTGQTTGPTRGQSMGRTTRPTAGLTMGQMGLASVPTTEQQGRLGGTTPCTCPRSGRPPATGHIPPLQFLSLNFTHSFSKISSVPSLEFSPHDQDQYNEDKPAPPIGFVMMTYRLLIIIHWNCDCIHGVVMQEMNIGLVLD